MYNMLSFKDVNYFTHVRDSSVLYLRQKFKEFLFHISKPTFCILAKATP